MGKTVFIQHLLGQKPQRGDIPLQKRMLPKRLWGIKPDLPIIPPEEYGDEKYRNNYRISKVSTVDIFGFDSDLFFILESKYKYHPPKCQNEVFFMRNLIPRQFHNMVFGQSREFDCEYDIICICSPDICVESV